MSESKVLDLTISNLPEKYKERILERRRTHGTRRTTFRDFRIILPPKPAEQPRTPEQGECKQLATPPSQSPNNDFIQDTSRSRSSHMSFGSPMEIDYSIDVGKIEVLTSKTKFSDEEEQSGIEVLTPKTKFNDHEEQPIEEKEKQQVEERASQSRRRSLRSAVKLNEQISDHEEQSDVVMTEDIIPAEEDEHAEVEEVHTDTEEVQQVEERISRSKKKPRRKSRTSPVKLNKQFNDHEEHSDVVMIEDIIPAEEEEHAEVEEVHADTEVQQVEEIIGLNKKNPRRKAKTSAVKLNKRFNDHEEQSDVAMNVDIIPAEEGEHAEAEGENVETIEVKQAEKKISRGVKKSRRNIKGKEKASVAKSNKRINDHEEQSDVIMDEDIIAEGEHAEVEVEEQQAERSKKRSRRKIKGKEKASVALNEQFSDEEQSDIVMDEDIVSAEEEHAEVEGDVEERINQGRRRPRRKIKCQKTSVTTKLNELDVISDTINEAVTEFLNNNPFKKEIQDFKENVEMHLLEQSDLLDEQIMLRSSLRKSKSRMNCLRKELLEVQRERDEVCRELANERRVFAKEEQDRKKLEQAHNFLTDLETLREAVDAEDNMQEDEEEILDGFKGLLISVTSRCSDISHSLGEATGNLGILRRFNMLLEVCERIVR